MNVPLLDLKKQYAEIQDELLPAVQAVVESGYYINGPAVKELEAAVAKYSGAAAAVGVSSGTDSLLVALMALGIGQDAPACRVRKPCAGCDEVITSAFTFFATAGVVWRAGARPVLVDIELDTYNIDPHLAARAVTKHTRAVLPVHLFGQAADMDPLLQTARTRKLHVIEDAAQAIGAVYKGRKAGSMGTAGCLSFYPTKNLGAIGDAGMILTQDVALAERMAICRDHGMKPRYVHGFVGGNFRLDTIQAAALLVKLPRLDGWAERRRRHAARYTELLAGFEPVVTPVVRPGNVSVVNQYVIRVPRRDALRQFLKEQGIGTEVYYPLGLHEQECFRGLGYRKGDFPNTEKAAAEVLALPIYPDLTDEQIVYVAGKVREFLSRPA